MKKPPAPETPREAYRMPPPNSDLLDWGGTLARVRLAATDDPTEPRRSISEITKAPGPRKDFFNPQLLEQMLDDDPALQKLLKKADIVGYDVQLPLITAAATRVMEEEYIPLVLRHYYEIENQVGSYVAAKHARQIAYPHEDEDETATPGTPDQRDG